MQGVGFLGGLAEPEHILAEGRKPGGLRELAGRPYFIATEIEEDLQAALDQCAHCRKPEEVRIVG